MAGEIDLPFEVETATLVGRNGRIARLGSTNTRCVEAANATTGTSRWLILQGAAVGQQATIRVFGLGQVIAGGTIATGDLVTADANGAGVATTTGGDVILGRAMRGGVAGELVEVLIGAGLNIVRTT